MLLIEEIAFGRSRQKLHRRHALAVDRRLVLMKLQRRVEHRGAVQHGTLGDHRELVVIRDVGRRAGRCEGAERRLVDGAWNSADAQHE